jgi:hypothetical protein
MCRVSLVVTMCEGFLPPAVVFCIIEEHEAGNGWEDIEEHWAEDWLIRNECDTQCFDPFAVFFSHSS